MSTAIQTISSDIYGIETTFNQLLVDKSINFQREAGFAIQILQGSDYAQKLAMGNRQSVVDAVTNCAAIGVSLNPAKRQAYLVPMDGGIKLQISYMGLIDLAVGSGSILWAQAQLVHQEDRFILNGFDKPPTHEFSPFSTARGPLVGVYVVVKTRDGDYLTHTMAIDAVYDIRNRSSAWKAWIAKQKKCPWVTDEGEMVRKSVVKQAYKFWPKTDRLDQAIHYLNTDGGEGIELSGGSAQSELAQLDPRAEWLQKAERAQSLDEMVQISKSGAKAFQATKDRDGYSAFAKAVQARGAQLRSLNSNVGVIDV